MSSYLYIVKSELPLVIQAFLKIDPSSEWVSWLVSMVTESKIFISSHRPPGARWLTWYRGGEVKVKRVVGRRCDAIRGVFDWLGLACVRRGPRLALDVLEYTPTNPTLLKRWSNAVLQQPHASAKGPVTARLHIACQDPPSLLLKTNLELKTWQGDGGGGSYQLNS